MNVQHNETIVLQKIVLQTVKAGAKGVFFSDRFFYQTGLLADQVKNSNFKGDFVKSEANSDHLIGFTLSRLQSA